MQSELKEKEQKLNLLQQEKYTWIDEKLSKESEIQTLSKQVSNLKEDLQDQKIKADLATDELSIFKKKLQGRDLSQQNSNQETIKDLQQKLQRKTEDLESLSLKHANLLISVKESKELPVVNKEVAHELSVMKQELKRLHGILAEKEKELVQAKLSENLQEGMSDKINYLKTDLINRESKLQEVELTLDLEKRKMETYEEHIQVLRGQIKELQAQINEVAKVCVFVQNCKQTAVKCKQSLILAGKIFIGEQNEGKFQPSQKRFSQRQTPRRTQTSAER